MVISIGLGLWGHKYTKHQNELETQDKRSDAQEEQIVKETKKKQKELQLKLKTLLAMLPPKKEIPTLLGHISHLGKECGLEFLLLRPTADVSKNFYSEIPVKIDVRGKYHALNKYFCQLSRMGRIVNISNLNIQTYKDSSQNLVRSIFIVSSYIVKQRQSTQRLEDLKNQIKTLDFLKASQIVYCKILDEIAQKVPTKLWLTSLSYEKIQMTIEGISLDNKNIAEFMRNLEKSPWFTNIELKWARQEKISPQTVEKFGISLKTKIPDHPIKLSGVYKRDPFAGSFKEAMTTKDFRISPINQIEVSTLKLIGIIVSPNGNKALVERPDGKGYVVKVGSSIGPNRGIVKEITKDVVIIEEQLKDSSTDEKSRIISLKLCK